MNSPILSIIIPTYNVERTIEFTLQSIICQNQNGIELIVIDGNSKDSTFKIVNKYKSYLSYFCSEDDRGVYDAMNKGILKANGKFIYFLGADDILPFGPSKPTTSPPSS